MVASSSHSWRRQWQPTPVLLPGKAHGRRSLVGCRLWGCTESDTTEQLHFHALEKEMATHSSVLAWRIPRTAEPGGLPSTGSHRVRHWSDLAAAAASHSASKPRGAQHTWNDTWRGFRPPPSDLSFHLPPPQTFPPSSPGLLFRKP